MYEQTTFPQMRISPMALFELLCERCIFTNYLYWFPHNYGTGSMEFRSCVHVIIVSFFAKMTNTSAQTPPTTSSKPTTTDSIKTWFNSKKWAHCYLFISNSGCIAPLLTNLLGERTFLNIIYIGKRQQLFHDSRCSGNLVSLLLRLFTRSLVHSMLNEDNAL